MKDKETINEYFARTLVVANEMTAQGKQSMHTTVVEIVLRSVTTKFNYVVCSIEESNDVTTLSIDELQGSLLINEQRMKINKRKNNKLSRLQTMVEAPTVIKEESVVALVDVPEEDSTYIRFNVINVTR